MPIQWTEDLSVGVPQIDKQHKELFSRINNLLEACSQGRGREIVQETIEFIGDYTITHFSTEERYMATHGYPEFKDHKALHDQFIERFFSLKKKVEEDGPGGHIVLETNRTIVTWLNSHIRNVDKKLGQFLKEKELL